MLIARIAQLSRQPFPFALPSFSLYPFSSPSLHLHLNLFLDLAFVSIASLERELLLFTPRRGLFLPRLPLKYALFVYGGDRRVLGGFYCVTRGHKIGGHFAELGVLAKDFEDFFRVGVKLLWNRCTLTGNILKIF